jgi:phosphonate degradation associated HDIG domain protein
MRIVDEVLTLYGRRDGQAYFGEPVSATEHGLQSAHFASRAEAPPALILAALLHDVGHLIDSAPDDIRDWTTDACHESSGARWLAARFGPEVSEPVRLHVAAKRYLCAIDAGYLKCLSAASVQTLQLQGGAMSRAEIAAFEREPHHRNALQVRHWDDGAKIAGLPTPDLHHYAPLLERLAASRARQT